MIYNIFFIKFNYLNLYTFNAFQTLLLNKTTTGTLTIISNIIIESIICIIKLKSFKIPHIKEQHNDKAIAILTALLLLKQYFVHFTM